MTDNSSKVRVRFAPSPTGALHIGGVRTALYNYLFARKQGGDFILRVEDTDQKRYREEAEDYIYESLDWLGFGEDEGPRKGGEHGPYRQSERKKIYGKYIEKLIENGKAYYAFDTPEELESMRERKKEMGVHTPKYDATVRKEMRNSLTLSREEVREMLENDTPYVVRLLVPEDEEVMFSDIVREKVQFDSSELDDKVLMKQDGMPTYHFANVVDDHLMEITHVIRGEEWLSSTGHHVLLYRAFGWEDQMPEFAHLPLILKPEGKGKLSKRDGQKLGIPVFPIAGKENDQLGFREQGFLPAAVINFLALLGWNPGDEREIFDLLDLQAEFDLDKVGKSGSRFDYDKALWFNQQHIIKSPADQLLDPVAEVFESRGQKVKKDDLLEIIELYSERVHTLEEFWSQSIYLFSSELEYDEKMVRKKWKGEGKEQFEGYIKEVGEVTPFERDRIASSIKGKAKEEGLGLGKILPLFRLAVCGTMQGPDVFKIMEFLGKRAVIERLQKAPDHFNEIKS